MATGDVARLAGLYDTDAVAPTVEQYRDTCRLETENPWSPTLQAVAAVDKDAARLAVGASALATDSIPDEAEMVVDVAVGYFFQKHETLRHAATAKLYATTSMSTGGTAMMAGVGPGQEIGSLVRDHDVTQRVGSGPVQSSDSLPADNN
jgi:hypothetical protein